VVDGADWMIEHLFANNSVTGLVRQADGRSDFLVCSRTAYDDRDLVLACSLARPESSSVEFLEPIVVPADFFRREDGTPFGRFPPRLDRFVHPERVFSLRIDRRDGTSRYVQDGPIETLDDGTRILRMIDGETEDPVILEATQSGDGDGLSAFDYKLTILEEEECSFDLFNVSFEVPVSIREHLVAGLHVDLVPAQGVCPNPLGPILNEVASPIFGRTDLVPVTP